MNTFYIYESGGRYLHFSRHKRGDWDWGSAEHSEISEVRDINRATFFFTKKEANVTRKHIIRHYPLFLLKKTKLTIDGEGRSTEETEGTGDRDRELLPQEDVHL